MAGMTDAQLLDLMKVTREHVEPGEIQVATRLANYPMSDWFLSEGNFETQDSGYNMRAEVVLDDDTPAQHAQLYSPDEIQITDVASYATLPWRRFKKPFAFERREILENMKGDRIFDLYKLRRLVAYQAICNTFEAAVWASPPTTGDVLMPHGIPYHIVPLDEGQNGAGFYGAGVTDKTSGHTVIHDSIAGIDPASSGDGTTAPLAATSSIKPRWRNYCAGGTGYYTGVDDTLMDTMAIAFYELAWKAPLLVTDISDRAKWKLRMYAAPQTLVKLERRAQKQNDNLGGDLHLYGGATFFKRTPFVPVPQLSLDLLSDGTTRAEPIYMIDHNTFKLRVLKGDHLRESDPAKVANNHNVTAVWIDETYNLYSTARWKSAVIRLTA